ncbi:MAG: hypothetical protein JKY65_24285, partial [Planctomycetes bacterium]|nr:hypothetical protein [Planctomycetota bacterium]
MTKFSRALQTLATVTLVPLALGLVMTGCSGGKSTTTVTLTRSLAFSAALPTSVAAGQTIAPAVVVTINDANGNTLTQATDVITIRLSSTSGGTLGGTLKVTAINGVATFTDLSADKVSSLNVLTATTADAIPATSSEFAVNPGAASQLRFVRQPNNTSTLSTMDVIEIEILDANENRVDTATTNVTLTLLGGAGTLSGTLSAIAVNGVASFSNLQVSANGSFTLRASGGFANTTNSTPFTIAPGQFAILKTLVFTGQPSTSTELAVVAPAMVVQLRNASGAVITTATDAVTLSLGNNPGSATLAGDLTVNAVSGVATFANVTVNRAGVGFSFTATAGGYNVARSNAFNVTAAAASQLAFQVQPSAASESAIIPPFQVAIRDSAGVIVNTTNPITLQMGNNPGGGVLSGQLTVNAVAGLATFANVSISQAGVGHTLTATSSGLTQTTSAAFDIAASTATQLAVTTQPPASVAENAGFSVSIQVRDSGGAPVLATIPVTISLASNPGSGTLGGTLTVNTNPATGIATFNPITINNAGVGYQLLANSTGLTSVLTNSFNVTGSLARTLSVSTQPPGTVVEGAGFGLQVTALDSAGAPVLAAVPVTISLASNPGSGTLGGILTVNTNAATGIATFTILTLDAAGNGYRLAATSSGLTSALSNTFNATATTARDLSVTGQPPASFAEGSGFGFQVTVRDSSGAPVLGTAIPVTVQLAANPGGATLAGPLTVNTSPATGIATFATLILDAAGAGYQLLATSPGLTSALTSPGFTVTASTATALVWGTQPTALPGTTAEGAVISGPAGVTVTIVDSAGVVVPGATNAITVQFGANPSSGNLSGTLTRSAVAGVATFDNLTIDQASALYSLSASSGALTPAQSNTFTVSASTARQLAFLAPPLAATEGGVINSPTGVTVQVFDSAGTLVTTATNPVTIQLGANPGSGTLGGTLTVSAINGVATFLNLTVDQAAGALLYSMTASSPGLTGATSAGFTVSPGAARQLGFLAPPLATVEGAAINTPGGVTVQIQDSNGAVVLGSTNLVTIQLGSNPGSGTLGGTLSANAVNGVATFANLTIDEANALPYTLTATSGALTAANSANFVVSAASADNLFFSAPPTTENAFTDINSPGGIVVFVRDSANGLVTAASQQRLVTLLIGTKSVMSVGGLATFTDIQINNPGVGYRLTAVATGLTAANSGLFDINGAAPSTADHLAITTGTPNDADENAVITTIANNPAGLPPVSVQIQDSLNALVAGATDLVTVSFANNPSGGTLSGTLTVPAVAGVATFNNLTINNAGTGYTLTFSASSLTGVTSAPFNIDPVTATNLAFLNQPAVTTGQNAQIAGAPAPSVRVQLRDAALALVTTSGVPITLQIAANPALPPGTLSGTLTALTVGGIATFPSLSINNSATNYTLVATAGSLTPAISNPFNITITEGAALSFAVGAGVQPTTPVLQSVILNPTVQLLDAAGNALVAPPGAGVRVTLSFGFNPAGGTLSGDLSVVTLAGGVAAFPNVSVNNVGAAYTLVASA